MTSKPVSKSANYYLDDDEKAIYGNRMADGYIKKDLLGKGGCGIVWLAVSRETGEEIAVK